MEEQHRSLHDVYGGCLIIELRVFRLLPYITTIGRDRLNDCVIDHPMVSRKHAKILHENGVYVIYDLDSTGGTYVNDRRVENAVLKNGDIILLGAFPIMFMYEDSDMIQKLDDEETGIF